MGCRPRGRTGPAPELKEEDDAPHLWKPNPEFGSFTLLKVKLLYQRLHIGCMAKSATISSKGQITLPKELREKYHLKEGETATVLDAGEGILIKHGRASLRGLLKGRIDVRGFEEDLRKLRKEWSL